MSLRNRGFSLIEIMVGLGIISIGMLGMTKVFTNQSKTNQRTQIFAEAAQVAADISLLLENTQACNNSILGTPPVTSVAQIDSNLTRLVDSTGATQFEVGADYSRGKYLQVTNITRLPIPGYTFTANQEFAFQVRVELTPKARYASTFQEAITKTIPSRVYLSINGAAEAIECLNLAARLAQEIKEEACKSIGGVYGIVNGNNDIWCTLPGTLGVNPRLNPNGAIVNLAAAKDYVELPTGIALHGGYIKRVDPSGVQEIDNHSLIFNQLSASSGIIINPSTSTNYAPVRSGAMSLVDFERRVPNYQWLQNNVRDMIRYEAIGGDPIIAGNPSAGLYCNEAAGNILLLAYSGNAVCVNMNDMACDYAPNGSPTYFNGLRPNGTANCIPLISGVTNCPNGGELTQNTNGELVFTCNSSCTPAGNWVDSGPNSYSCFCDGTSQNIQKCETSCGGVCPGGGVEGDVRLEPGNCVIPAYCDTGSSVPVPDPSGGGTSCNDFAGDSCIVDSQCGPGDGICVGTPRRCECGIPSGGGPPGNSCGNNCNNARYRDLCNCCPNNYPHTGDSYGCCENNGGDNICL